MTTWNGPGEARSWNGPGAADDPRSTDPSIPDFEAPDQPYSDAKQDASAAGDQQTPAQSYQQPAAQSYQQPPAQSHWQPNPAGFGYAERDVFTPFAESGVFDPYADPTRPARMQGQQLSPQSSPPYYPADPYTGYSLTPLRPYSTQEEHPNGTIALVLGILGFFVGVTAPFAWWLGASGRADARKYPGRYSNEGALTAGMICGAIVTIGMLAMIASVLLAIVLAAA